MGKFIKKQAFYKIGCQYNLYICSSMKQLSKQVGYIPFFIDFSVEKTNTFFIIYQLFHPFAKNNPNMLILNGLYFIHG